MTGMKRIGIAILFAALCSITATSCLREDFSGVTLDIHLILPEDENGNVDLTQVEVKLQSKDISFTYIKYPDAEGHVTFEVRPGKYDIVASAYFKGTRTAVNASVQEFLLTSEGIIGDSGEAAAPVIEMTLNVAKPNALIIREIYYHGSTTFEGSSYILDQYLELYNNAGPGGESVYLDSMCIATIFPANSTSGNNAWIDSDTIAIFQMFWMFPGDGATYRLDPGESCVIATRAAVDHSQRATSKLQLNKAHFGCYADHLTGHEIAAGVIPMVCYMAGQGTAWGLSVSSPAVVVFKPEMGVTNYRNRPDLWERYEPGKTSGTKYWHIAKEWIIDGVECADTPEGAIKRLPGTIDASYTWMRSARYSGKCITRKQEFVQDGIEVFMDTNNSDSDFIPDSTPSPRLKQ